MRRRLVKELVDALEDSAHAGTAKNVYEAYVPHAERKRRHKEKKAEALLISLCTKLAFSLKPRIKPVTLPKIVPSTPPGISRNVGKLNPGVMTSKNMSQAGAGSIVKPSRPVPAAMTAGTTMGVPR
jgi:hypothetical protein